MRNIASLPVVFWLWIWFLAWWPGQEAAGQGRKPHWLWAQSGGGSRFSRAETGQRIVVDANGNSYVAGSYVDSARFGRFILRNGQINGTSSFLAKYDVNGALQWIFGNRNLRVYDLALDPGGDCYALVSGDTLPGGVRLSSTQALAVVRLGTGGQVAWMRTVAPRSVAYDARLAIDRQGKIYVAGGYARAVEVGGVSLTTPIRLTAADTLMGRWIFVACFNQAWNLQWLTNTRGSTAQQVLGGLKVDAAGNAYGVVNFSDSITLGNDLLVRTQSQNFRNYEQALFKITTGQFAWARQVVRNGDGSAFTGLTVDSVGNSYVAGTYMGLALFDNITQFSNPPSAYNTFLVKYNPTGQQLWFRDLRGRTQQQGLTARGAVEIDRAGYIYQAGDVMVETYFGQDTLGGIVFQNRNLRRAVLLKYTPSGAPGWGLSIGNDTSNLTITALAFDQRGRCLLTGSFDGNPRLGSVSLMSRGGSDVLVAKLSRDSLSQGVADEICEIGGRVFFDVDANGQQGAGEGPVVAPVIVEMQPGPLYLTTADGQFFSGVVPGSYNLTVPYPPRHYTLTSPPQTAVFTAPGQRDTTNQLGLHAGASVVDLRISLTAINNFIPGRLSNYRLVCRNMGTVPESGTIVLTLDPRLHFVQSTPTAPATISNHTLRWHLAPLPPLQEMAWNVLIRNDSTLRFGDTITSIATLILPVDDVDAYPADNADTTSVRVRAAYDPNDKLVSHAQLSPRQVQNGQWLTYTVRFQNTGNAPAMRVRIVDTLTAQLQRGTLEVLAASHPFTWQLRGKGIAEFLFTDINLPDSSTNEPASRGFVKFRLRVQPTLPVGDTVRNTAHIFFDFNEAITTNTATTAVVAPPGVPGISSSFSLYPNPAQQAVRLSLSAVPAGVLNVRVVNALGQLIWASEQVVPGGSVQQSIPVRGWAPGVYYVQVSGGWQGTQQLVVVP